MEEDERIQGLKRHLLPLSALLPSDLRLGTQGRGSKFLLLLRGRGTALRETEL